MLLYAETWNKEEQHMQQGSSATIHAITRYDIVFAIGAFILCTLSFALIFLSDVFPLLLGFFGPDLSNLVSSGSLISWEDATALPAFVVACLLAGVGMLCLRKVRSKVQWHTRHTNRAVSAYTISTIGITLASMTLMLALLLLIFVVIMFIMLIASGGMN